MSEGGSEFSSLGVLELVPCFSGLESSRVMVLVSLMGGCIGRELYVYVVRSEGKKLMRETVFLEELYTRHQMS